MRWALGPEALRMLLKTLTPNAPTPSVLLPELAEHQNEEHRSEDRSNEPAPAAVSERVEDESGHERASNAKQDRHRASLRLAAISRHQGLGDHACDKTDEDHPEDMHARGTEPRRCGLRWTQDGMMEVMEMIEVMEMRKTPSLRICFT